jgi:hypothetical protein
MLDVVVLSGCLNLNTEEADNATGALFQFQINVDNVVIVCVHDRIKQIVAHRAGGLGICPEPFEPECMTWDDSVADKELPSNFVDPDRVVCGYELKEAV